MPPGTFVKEEAVVVKREHAVVVDEDWRSEGSSASMRGAPSRPRGPCRVQAKSTSCLTLREKDSSRWYTGKSEQYKGKTFQHVRAARRRVAWRQHKRGSAGTSQNVKTAAGSAASGRRPVGRRITRGQEAKEYVKIGGNL